MEPRLRIATLNIWNRSGPWPERLAGIRAEMRALVPDVLGLQEVLRQVPPGSPPNGVWSVPDAVVDDGTADQASVIAAGTHRHVAYARAADYGNGLAFGNAVVSKYPIVEHAAFELPGHETGETRSLLYALVQHPAGLLPLFVTHLNWKLHHGAIRVKQVQFLCDRVKELAPVEVDGSRLPPVLMGDFNASPDADEMRYLAGLHPLDGKSVYFADAWVYGGDGTPGFTFDRKNRFAANAHEPSRRIDYIFVRGPDAKLRGEPLETRLAFSKWAPGANGPVWPSDHFGVATDVSVEPKSWA